jgi:hypothetical protein
LGTLATLISSVLDHARTNFENPWLWVPTAADLITYAVAMLLLVAVGVVGALLHVDANLTAGGIVVIEDPCGNRIEYECERDTGEDGPHRWDQLYLRRLRYVGYEDETGAERFLVSAPFDYGEAP